MTSVHHPPATGDLVVGALGGLGTLVDCASSRSLRLEGPQVLWLVADGAMDLFAVDAVNQGSWHFLGRLETGALLLGPVDGPQHTLVGRPLRGCVLRRIEFRELFRPEYEYNYEHQYQSQQYGDQWSPDGGEPVLSPLEDAFARGIGRGLRVLFEMPGPGSDAPVGGYEPADENILWMPVDPGSLQYGAPMSQEGAWDLLIDGALWQRLINQQSRLLLALDRWIEQLDRAHEDRTAAGIKAGEAVRAHADQALLASIDGPDRSGRPAKAGRSAKGSRSAKAGKSARSARSGSAAGDHGAGGEDATLAVCRLVAEAAGIKVVEPAAGASAAGGSAADGSSTGRLNPVERIALSSRFRTRVVALGGRWWRENTGPLVGQRAASGAPVALLWRRGRYEAVEPVTGRRTRIDAANADQFEPRAVMFYRPLPEQALSAWRLLGFSVRGTRADLRNLILGGLVAVGLGTLVPIATGQVLGAYVPQGENGLIVQTALAVAAATLVSAAFMLLQNISILRLEGRIEATLQPAVWDRLLRLPTRFFAERSTGELAGAAMGISAIRRVLSGITSVTVQAGTVGAVNLVLLLCYSPLLALAAIALLIVIASLFLGLGMWQLRWQRRLIKLNHKLNNQAFQTLRGLPKLRVAAAESFAYAAWAREFARSRELQQRVGRIKNLITVLNAVYLPLCTLLMFVLLAGPARGSLSASGFLTFNTAVTMMLTSATQLTGALISAAAVLPMFEQIKPVLQELPEVRGGSAQPGTLAGGIEVRQLSFRYAEDGPLVLDNVSFQVQPGEFVAIVGASGCGKSTLLRLLIGFDRPASGSVLYDGQDLAALDQAAVRRQCGVVLQNAQPFTGSILDSICGAELFSLEEAWEAAEMAGLAEDIKLMPMGMHTVLSDGGGTVSGGQRQRLMIAQALIRRPRVLFFDEATSALDNETQRIVIASTRKLQATRIVIAHRLSTVLDADRVIVMSEGRVIQQGPPTELLADRGGVFHELVRRQIG
ncbi:NHLM bacteriocin system ABC transporter ATP-binding protein [Kitasatospora sp. GAS204A]|uniref:NHLP bacteriocin export ABC transporter permease/ATPase subunit n=1 Tax=unclassified Kitasatospora TaxID=2633591 RepID=UPI00247590CF|nr:NHLP bacteriocin export ABC transporter permease/ATPase subunit [Kitasatospora sp. GAS204B]MDH6120810.1 NHLM bacteriocin system ABC transporter ATP-binding protein [Kitasatospora sp. GAS204B]